MARNRLFKRKSVLIALALFFGVQGLVALVHFEFYGATGGEFPRTLNEIGDSFGVINAIVSALGIALIAYSFGEQVHQNRMTRIELRLQRSNLKLQRIDTQNQSDAISMARQETRETRGASNRLLRLQEFSRQMQWLQAVASLDGQLDELTHKNVGNDEQEILVWHRKVSSLCAHRLIANRFLEEDQTVRYLVADENRVSEDLLALASYILDIWTIHRSCYGRELVLPTQPDSANCEVHLEFKKLMILLNEKWSGNDRAKSILSVVQAWDLEGKDYENCNRILISIYDACRLQSHRLAMKVVSHSRR